MKNKKNNKYMYLGLAVLAVSILVFGWLYLSMQPTSLVVKSDKTDYFKVDTVKVEILLNNPKNATEGKVVVKYSTDLLKIKEQTLTNGVTMREIEGSLIFDLSTDYFKSKNPVIGNFSFDSLDRGTAKIQFLQAQTSLKENENVITVNSYTDANIGIGVTGRDAIKQ